MTSRRPGNSAPRATKLKARLGMIVGSVLVVAACVVIRYIGGGPDPVSADPAGPPSAAGDTSKLKIVAVVNNEQVTREQLGNECLRHYGQEVLESMINKQLIGEQCKRQNIVISRADVAAEIERMAQRFGLTTKQWLEMLKQERGITPLQYASDIIWPTLALRRLAGERLKVTGQELQEVFDMQYGEAVRARLIACNDLPTARKIRQTAAAKPDDFGELAKKHSVDSSASVKGLIQPIRKCGSFKEIEQAAFNLADGEVSQVIPAAGQYVILKREGLVPAAKVDLKQVAPQLEEIVRERKMRALAGEVFLQLQKQSKVEDFLKEPARGRNMPGVAAVIDSRQITMRDLAEQCIDRYGEQVLEGTINRKLLEQACKKRNITVSKEEIDREVVRAAAEMVPPKQDGSPDVETWLKTVTERQNVTVDVYRNDAVWPSVALKKLAGEDVKVTEEDLKKGYESNYGPRVRCRAIVMANARRAQQIWEKARQKPTVENFGTLAEQFSIEPQSQQLRGEVPPISRHGGQPLLEEQAFSLKPGDLSSIVQVGDKFVFLFCEGYTEPVNVSISFQEVRDEIYKDLHEKKLRLAMAECFEQLQDAATIDNYLAGTSKSPKEKSAGAAASRSAGGKQATGSSPPRAGSILGARKPATMQK